MHRYVCTFTWKNLPQLFPIFHIKYSIFHFLLPCIKLNQILFLPCSFTTFHMRSVHMKFMQKHCPLLNLLMVWYLITNTKMVLNYPISCATTNFTNRWKQVTVYEGACHILECQNIFGRLRPATTFLEMFSNQTDMLILHLFSGLCEYNFSEFYNIVSKGNACIMDFFRHISTQWAYS